LTDFSCALNQTLMSLGFIAVQIVEKQRQTSFLGAIHLQLV